MEPRARIIQATVEILAREGRDGVSTRAVSAAAGVQAPTIYRLFGDKQGLLDAVATHGFQAYLAAKEARPAGDPVEDLARGFEGHVEFGLANPALYSLMVGDGRPSPAAAASGEVLARLVRRIAEAGRLKVTEEQAVQLIHATGSGITMSLLAMPAEQRDLSIVARARDALIGAVTTDAAGAEPAAVTLRAALPRITRLSTSEKALLAEWLDRISPSI